MTTRKSTAGTGTKKLPARKRKAAAQTSDDAPKESPAAKRVTASPAAAKPANKPKHSQGDIWTLRLYIAGRGERSERALRNLRSLCEANMKEGTYKIEVIDLAKKPALAKADQILAIPTLVRKLPEPMKRIIGDLSNADRALLSLDLPKQQ